MAQNNLGGIVIIDPHPLKAVVDELVIHISAQAGGTIAGIMPELVYNVVGRGDLHHTLPVLGRHIPVYIVVKSLIVVIINICLKGSLVSLVHVFRHTQDLKLVHLKIHIIAGLELPGQNLDHVQLV